MSNEIQKWFAHIDLDAFFASVEQLDHPEYKGKPVIVGGRPEDRRGVVSTASYEARKFGVHSAMPTFQAYKLCPQGIFVHGNYKRYSELSYKIMTIFKDYSPEVNQMSIDEAFIDLTGTEKLFGPPEETCRKIKERVKLETGLTVSVGLASTKYVAKICSGYKKPDGFFKVEPGKETEFMLSLPLEKVWGVGEKTLQNLHQKGIFTTSDIYNKDLETLTFLFGNNTAAFLYDVVRGGKNEAFRKETKSHSISAERTFPFDLTDSYTLETEILELSQDVMFRLLKEKSYSRTAFLKLRYDDFTTVTVQKTLDQNIKTLDFFYEQLVQLFNQKKEKGRGIRLIGVGFENVETTDRPEQQSLFNDNEQKKQQVEKAILQLNQKHPEIKVQKARTLKRTLALLGFVSTLLFAKGQKLYAENQTANTGAGTILSDNLSLPQENNSENYFLSPEQSDTDKFEFNLSGFWNSAFESSFLTTFGNDTPFGCSFANPVFKQEVELSAWFIFNRHWYFDTSFADGFEKNTFSLGYKNGGYLNSALLSNRNIGFTNDYSSAYFGYGLKGGKNQAPGIAVQFLDTKNGRWKGDLIVRYDMTTSKEAVFYGMNNVTDQTIELNNFVYGKKFILPEAASNALGRIKNIYVESSTGEYTDSNYKHYKKLSASQYAVYQNLCQIDFTNDAGTQKSSGKIPSILVTFNSEGDTADIINATGSYSDSSSFAGQIQKYFNSENSQNIDLSKYTFKLENRIENSSALVIQNSAGFSPYLCAAIYDCGIIDNADVSIINESTEQISSYLTTIQINENDSLLNDFLYESHYYAQVMMVNSENSSLQLPQNRFPAAAWNPQLYLNLKSDTENILRVRTYSPVTSLQIGTNAVEGTVYVYKNGIIDSGAKYNSDTGIVELSSPLTDTDKIVIHYQEDSTDNSGGSLAAGFGFIYNFTPDFYWDTSLTTRMPLSINQKYSTADSDLYSFTAFTNGITYNTRNLQLSDKLAIAIQNPDQTGNLLANSNDSYINQTYYLSSASGYKTQAIPYINEYLQEQNNGTMVQSSGIQNSYISGYAIPLSWNFTDLPTDAAVWASADIKLDYGNLLSQASTLEFALKPEFEDSLEISDFELYLQFGICAASTFYGEDSSTVRTWNISSLSSRTTSAIDLSSNSWQTVKIALDDYDRSMLTSNYDARFILIRKSGSSQNNTGRILIGPYEPYVQSIFTKADDDIFVQSSTELTTASPSSSDFNINKNYSTRISWQINTTSEPSDYGITAVTNFEEADFSNYTTVNFDFAYEALSENTKEIQNSNPAFTFILDRESLSSDTEGKVALKLLIKSLQNEISEALKYHTVSVNIKNNEVYIDNNLLDNSAYSLYINKNVIPSRQKLVINTITDNTLYTRGAFYINNLYYSNSVPYAAIQNNLTAKYSKTGSIIQIKDYSLLRDASLALDSTQSYTTLSNTSLNTSAEVQATVCNITLQTDVNTKYNSTDNNFYIAGAGHNIQTAAPLFKFLTLGENYRFDQENNSLSKASNASLNFGNSGFKLSGKTDASDSLDLKTQNVQLMQNYSHSFSNISFNFDTTVQANQKVNTLRHETQTFNTSEYFKGWYDISTLQFSPGIKDADQRSTLFKINSGLNFNSINFTPSLEYNAGSDFTNSTEQKYLLTQNLIFKLPLKINKQTISFNYTKKSSDSLLSAADKNYFDDTSLLFQNIINRDYFIKAVPFGELFSSRICKNLSTSDSQNLYSAYSSRYEIEWKRPLLNSIQDMYLPLSASFAMERDTKLSDSLSDIYQLKLNLNSSAINCFGTKSVNPVCHWFESDEFISSFTSAIKIPADKLSDLTFSVAWYGQFLVYINENSFLNTAVDFQIDTGNTWDAKATAIYSRPSQKSFIAACAGYFIPSDKEINFNIIQKETLNLKIGKNTTQFFQQYDYTHTTSVKFLKNYSIDLGLGGTFNWNELSACSLAINLTLGGKMEF